ncbi:hypothetical protein LTS10_000016 [Elasticomyces elasticus]|nr:hypothetical protein LTS10_000016 [Elasticomyces elasticus]
MLQWYKFAHNHRVYNIDDFDQINGDLRPFWAVPPAKIRHYAAHASDIYPQLGAMVSLRQGQVFQELWGWRSETFVKMSSVAQWLPDMDISINRMDQPRVIVPWEEMQSMLEIEEQSRPSLMDVQVRDGFTTNMSGFWQRKPPAPSWWSNWNPFYFPIEHVEDRSDPPPDYGYFWYASQQQYMDVGFTDFIACLPNCSFYATTFSLKSIKSFAQTFRSKYVVDVDGHSSSGRWRAFLQSRSLGIKATMFREWHDSRLFSWKHFVPMDNRFDELYSLLTYFIGLSPADNAGPMIPRHDHEAS